MSIKTPNPFGAIKAVIYENRDSLFYTGTAYAIATQLMGHGHVGFCTAFAATAREIVRFTSWARRCNSPQFAIDGGRSNVGDYQNFALSSLFGGMYATILGSGIYYAFRPPSSTDAAMVAVAGYAVIQGHVFKKMLGGYKGIWENYKMMWNYTDDDGKGGHTQRMLNKIKGAFGKATEWVAAPAPQAEPIPATIPVRQYCLAPAQ